MLNSLLVEDDIKATLLETALKAHQFNILKTHYSAAFLKFVQETRPDLLIFNLRSPSEALLADIQTLNQKSPLPVIMFTLDGRHETLQKAMQAEISAFVVDGLDSQRINSIIQIGLARFKQQQILKHALDEALTQLEDRKQIDRAKAILIKTQNYTEDVAYHTLRKLAMDRNITLGEMAKNVIAMADLLK